MPATHGGDDAIRQARRLGDPAAVCAALAVMRAWEAEEGRGRALAERFVDEGLLTGEQIRCLTGAEVACTVSSNAASARHTQPAFEPAPASVAVIDAPTPSEAPRTLLELPGAETRALASSSQTAEVAAAEEPRRDPSPPGRPVRVERPSRVPMMAAAVLGVAVALASWLSYGGEHSQARVPSPARSHPAPPLTTPQPALRPQVPAPPRTQPAPAAPQPAPPPAPRAPMWAPAQRQVREGDSSAIHDRLRLLASQIQADPDPTGVSFEARQLLRRAPRKDRLLRWVELTLGRFHTVADLRLDGAIVAWARE